MTIFEPAYASLFVGSDFEALFAIEGAVAKTIQNRSTRKFSCGEQQFFIKSHQGVGWGEIFKNLLRLTLPVLGAENEWLAIHRLRKLGIATMTPVGFGKKGWNPASRRSFLVTEDLGPSISLEQLTEGWSDCPPPQELKRVLIERVADIARSLHHGGINHRDFYLCHFLLQAPADPARIEQLPLYVIDLHRAQLRSRTPRRWMIKDIGGLYFSAIGIGLTRRDLFRFIKRYRNRPLRETLRDEQAFWKAVESRANKMRSKLRGS